MDARSRVDAEYIRMDSVHFGLIDDNELNALSDRLNLIWRLYYVNEQFTFVTCVCVCVCVRVCVCECVRVCECCLYA